MLSFIKNVYTSFQIKNIWNYIKQLYVAYETCKYVKTTGKYEVLLMCGNMRERRRHSRTKTLI